MLFNSNSEKLLIELNRKLKEKTLDNWNTHSNTKILKYSPWICGLSNLKSLPIEVIKTNLQKGQLLTNKNELVLLNKFLTSQGKFIVKRLSSHEEETFKLFDNIVEIKENQIFLFKKALNLIDNSNEYFKELWYNYIDSVLPLNMYPNGHGLASSSNYSRGIIYISLYGYKENETLLAIDLIHELGHQVLMTINSADPFFTHDPINVLVYSGVRETNRPAIQSLHGGMALAFMMKFCSTLESKKLGDSTLEFIEEKKKNYNKKLKATVDALKKNCSFTRIGNRIIEDFERVLI